MVSGGALVVVWLFFLVGIERGLGVGQWWRCGVIFGNIFIEKKEKNEGVLGLVMRRSFE